MALGLLAAGLSAAGGIAKMITGFKQKKEAKNLQKSNFIPQSMRENLSRLKMNAASNMLPGYNQAKENINQSTSNSIRAAGSGSISDKLNQAQSANISEKDALATLDVQGAQFKQGNEDRLNAGLNQQAQVEMDNEKTFRALKQQLLNSGQQNIFGGMNDLATVGTTYAAGGFDGNGRQGDIKSLMKMDPRQLQEAIGKGYIDPESYTPAQRIQLSQKLSGLSGGNRTSNYNF